MIELEAVHMTLAGREVLRGISLSVEPADRLVILGESGIGKSTILKIMLGLWKPDRGEVRIDGRDIHLLRERERIELLGQLAVVFQGGALFDSLTVGENVGYRLFEEGRLSQEEVEEIVRHKLSAVGMEESIDLYPSQLSGGMRKRAAIARAIAVNPRYVLFDEPTAGLDPVAAHLVNDLILRCQMRGEGTVVVTHDLDCAFRVGTRLMLIHDGGIAFEGDRRAMEASPEPAVGRFLRPGEALAGEQGKVER